MGFPWTRRQFRDWLKGRGIATTREELEKQAHAGMLRWMRERLTTFPRIVCLCGSTRFWREFQEAGLRETLAGRIVLSIGCARCADNDDKSFGGQVPVDQFDQVKAKLDELHLRKIDLADEVLVLNVGGYVGESTRREVAYARQIGRPIRWLEPPAD